MKLYATTTSERASKGQGGNKQIEVHVSANRTTLFNALIKHTGDNMFSLEIRDKDFKEVYWNTFSIPEKGKRQKGDIDTAFKRVNADER